MNYKSIIVQSQKQKKNNKKTYIPENLLELRKTNPDLYEKRKTNINHILATDGARSDSVQLTHSAYLWEWWPEWKGGRALHSQQAGTSNTRGREPGCLAHTRWAGRSAL